MVKLTIFQANNSSQNLWPQNSLAHFYPIIAVIVTLTRPPVRQRWPPAAGGGAGEPGGRHTAQDGKVGDYLSDKEILLFDRD